MGIKKTIRNPNSAEPMGKSNFFAKLNPDEIILDMEEIDYEETRPNSQLNKHYQEPSEENVADELSTRSSVIPTQESEAFEMQQRIDALLASIGSTPVSDNPEKMIDDSTPNLWTGDPNDQILQPKSESWPSSNSRDTMHRQHNRSKMPFNEFWYLDYYDPSFNEDPWESLEKKKA